MQEEEKREKRMKVFCYLINDLAHFSSFHLFSFFVYGKKKMRCNLHTSNKETKTEEQGHSVVPVANDLKFKSSRVKERGRSQTGAGWHFRADFAFCKIAECLPS